MRAMRRGYLGPAHRLEPAFMRPKYAPTKQIMRDATAEAFAEHLHGVARPNIFVLPYYHALCARTIDRLIPDAEFYGVDLQRSIVDNVATLDSGKRIHMQHTTIHRYIANAAGQVVFQAAFLDYFGSKGRNKLAEVTAFADRLMAPKSVMAVTLQGEGKADGDEAAMVRAITQNLLTRLKQKDIVASVLHADGYVTGRLMVHIILGLERVAPDRA